MTLNFDTARSVNQTRDNGYYRKSMTLGEGGWGEIYKFASDWKTYVLEIDGEISEEIKACNDGVAIHVFETLFTLDDTVLWEVYEKVTTIRNLAGNL